MPLRQKAVLEFNVYDKDFGSEKKVKRYGRVFLVGEKEIELFPIGVLAEIIERSPQTIMIWEKEGGFPKPMYKLPKGKCIRWYSKKQILGIRDLYQKYGRKRGRFFDKTMFLKEVRERFFLFDAAE